MEEETLAHWTILMRKIVKYLRNLACLHPRSRCSYHQDHLSSSLLSIYKSRSLMGRHCHNNIRVRLSSLVYTRSSSQRPSSNSSATRAPQSSSIRPSYNPHLIISNKPPMLRSCPTSRISWTISYARSTHISIFSASNPSFPPNAQVKPSLTKSFTNIIPPSDVQLAPPHSTTFYQPPQAINNKNRHSTIRSEMLSNWKRFFGILSSDAKILNKINPWWVDYKKEKF